jgi:Na+/melibiose symporter-like transporter
MNTTAFRRRDFVKITILGFATTALWQSLHSIILPLRLLDFIPESQKNTYLSILTLCGLLLAMFAQPIAGAISDRISSRWGRRRPFIFIGIIIAVLLLPGIGLAGSFAVIFVIYCLLQVTANVAQGPYQAYIPELVPTNKRGTAAGFRSLFELAGGVIFVLLAGYCYNAHSGLGGLWIVLGAIGFVLLATTLATVFMVKEPASPVVKQQASPRSALANLFKGDVWKNSNFIWFLVSRLLFYMAFTTIQQFAFYYLQDVVKVADPSTAASHFIVIAAAGMLVVVWPAGYLSDRIGRKSLTAFSALLGAAGIGVIALSHEYNSILLAAGIIGVAKGIFDSTNWALATDFAPKNEEARYLGIANMATAGGAVLARTIGPGIDYFNGVNPLSGYNFMLIMCIVYFVIGGVLVFGIKKRA